MNYDKIENWSCTILITVVTVWVVGITLGAALYGLYKILQFIFGYI